MQIMRPSHLLNWLFNPPLLGGLLFVGFLIYYVHAALSFPTLFNVDNHLNHAATRYISEHLKLPVIHDVENREIEFSKDGATRLLRPPFTYIVSAAVAKASEGMVESNIRKQRLGAALLGALTVLTVFVGFQLAFQQVSLSTLGATAIGLLPKFVFLSSCNNDDIGAIFSVSLLFASVLALRRYGASTKVLFALAFSLGLVLQTKYTAWLVLPWFALYSAVLLSGCWQRLLKLMPLLLLVFIASGGWWLIFNMANYGLNDPTALRHAAELQREITGQEPNQTGYASTGVSYAGLLLNHDQFLSKSYKSFIGYLEWIELDIGAASYTFYGLLMLLGLGFAIFRVRANWRNRQYFELIILLMITSQFLFYVHHNWARDIQPQARYVLPIIVPLLYLFTELLRRVPNSLIELVVSGKRLGFRVLSTFGLLFICLCVHVTTFANYVVPSYIQEHYQTSLKQTATFAGDYFVTKAPSDAVSFGQNQGSVILRRVGTTPAELLLNSDFCDSLPKNSLISIHIFSPAKGGLHLRVDVNGHGDYDKISWKPVIEGDSVVNFAANSQQCSRAKLTLAKGTYELVIKQITISELRINQHSRPI